MDSRSKAFNLSKLRVSNANLNRQAKPSSGSESLLFEITTIRSLSPALSRPISSCFVNSSLRSFEIVCVSKAELTDAKDVRDALAAELGREVLFISAVTGEGLQKLVGKAAELITEQRKLDREAKEKTKAVVFATEKAVRETEGEPAT